MPPLRSCNIDGVFKKSAWIEDLLELLQGIGSMLQEIDAKLETIIDLLSE